MNQVFILYHDACNSMVIQNDSCNDNLIIREEVMK
jgi:hypothetical protein